MRGPDRSGNTPPTPSESTFSASPSGTAPHGTVGPYRILEKIGEGGMGEAFLAEQTFPVRRRVALKLIKRGMDTKEVVARFESERQALALLNHPNIAHVFDAGSTPDGRPYFAMEFVQGISIREYCDTQRLAVPDRLRLFMEVCEGVQHAHQKGIIHRDLKPSNILVTVQDGKAVPKIIDFGIAKATSQRLTESTLHTSVGHLMGTPAYMSPEQADYTLLDIDTRTDVYSLGAVLYELLTGELALGKANPQAQGYEEIIRSIREVEPMRPSARVTTAAAPVARSLGDDVRTLARDLRGDLDWIVLKALEKDRTRRYDSASELAADIERHLTHEPVLASPPSTPYRVRKFVRRHRVSVAAGVAVGLALIAGIVGTSVGLVRAQEAEHKARVAERKAREEAETATEVTDLMADVFRTSDPSQAAANQFTASGEARGSKITAREVLDKGAERIQQRLVGKPVVRARLMGVIGNAYAGLGLDAAAEPLLRESLAMQEKTYGPNSPEVATSLWDLTWGLGQERYPGEALDLQRRALAIRQKALGPRHLDTAYSEWGVGISVPRKDGSSEARLHIRRALEIFQSIPGQGERGASWCLNDLGLILVEEGNYGEALPYFREALRLKEKFYGPEHPDVAGGLNDIGYNLMLMGRYSEALPLLEKAVRMEVKCLGPQHPAIAGTLHSLGECLRRMGRNAEARRILERAVKLDDGYTEIHQSLAVLYAGLGLGAEADLQFRRAAEQIAARGDTRQVADWYEKYAAEIDRDGRSEEAAVLRARAKNVRGIPVAP
jgi:eukaryotic-like serine/threonine-protein kinase